MAPLAVAIVIGGQATKQGAYMKKRRQTANENWSFFDLREMLDDPLDDAQVFPGVDGTDPTTIQAVYSQKQFGVHIVETIDKLRDGTIGPLVDVECKSGFHRADTFGRTLQATCNAILDGKGERMFNVQIFPLHNLTKKGAAEAAVDRAVEWATQEAWTLVCEKGIRLHQRYAYEAASQRRESFATFDMIWKHVADVSKSKDDNVESGKGQSWETGASSSDNRDPKWKNILSRTRGHDRSRSRGRFSSHDDQRRSSHDGAAWAPRDDQRRLSHDGAASAPYDDQRRHARAETADYRRVILEHWQQIGPGVDLARCWAAELSLQGVDAAAQKELFLLSQQGDDEFRAANSIMGKVFKKMADNESYETSVSAFVHSCVKKARDKKWWR